jgi:hypothetical protein
MIHFFFILAILAFGFGCYGAFFREKYVQNMWEGAKYLPFLPDNYKDFVPVCRGLMLVTLISVIALYILIITGVITK